MKATITFLLLCTTTFLHAQLFYNDGSKWGIMDSTGNIIVPCKYGYVDGFYNKYFSKIGVNGKRGVVNKAGKEIIPPQYDDLLYSEAANLFRVNQNKKWGLIDLSGKEVLPIEYNYCFANDDGTFSVAQDSKHGHYDKTGKPIIPVKYDRVYQFENGSSFLVSEGRVFSLIDKKSNTVKTLKYDSIISVRRNVAEVGLSGKCGIIDSAGNEIIPTIYENVLYYEDGFIAAKRNGKWGVINKKSEEITQFKYEVVSIFREGLAAVSVDGYHFGFINQAGREVTPLIYIKEQWQSLYFQHGLAEVKSSELKPKFFIDKTGKEVLVESRSSYGKIIEAEPTENFYDGINAFERGYYEIAFKKLKEEADKGQVQAMSLVARLYYNGQGTGKDADKALMWIQKAADKGDAEAMRQLASFMMEKNDPVKAWEWYQRSAALGNMYAMNQIGIMYANGTGVEKDYDKAYSWFYKAAELGSSDARKNIGHYYLYGSATPNYAEAFEWFYKAYKMNKNMPAATSLGWLYANGFGIKKNIKEAKRLFEEAGKANDGDAFNYLGLLYLTDQLQCNTDYSDNYKAALAYFTEADKLRNVDAIYNMGTMLLNGLGTKKNTAEAVKLFKAAAAKGHTEAAAWLKQHNY